MVNKVTEAVSHLMPYKHGYASNFEKRTLNNRDAVAFLLFSCGPMKFKDLQDAMNLWRMGTCETKEVDEEFFVQNKHDRGGRLVTRTKKVPQMYFTYLFNSSHAGGYGCVGADIFTRGNFMVQGWSGRSREQYRVKGKNFLRRTYWFRAGRATYAATLECAKRMSEIGHFFS